jgi:hypothetical protein
MGKHIAPMKGEKCPQYFRMKTQGKYRSENISPEDRILINWTLGDDSGGMVEEVLELRRKNNDSLL